MVSCIGFGQLRITGMIIASNISEKSVRMELPPGVDRSQVAHAPSGFLPRLASLGHSAMNFLAPFGYEDEIGFHYGDTPPLHEPDQTRHAW
jgi:hypothetical protein